MKSHFAAFALALIYSPLALAQTSVIRPAPAPAAAPSAANPSQSPSRTALAAARSSLAGVTDHEWMTSGTLPEDHFSHVSASAMRTLADAGEAQAQFVLGMLYDGGTNGLQADDTQAAHYYSLAANQNFAPAQGASAYHYFVGRGVPKDLFELETTRLRQLSAVGGYAPSQASMADRYYCGNGVEKDQAHGQQLLGAAIAQGYNVQQLQESLRQMQAGTYECRVHAVAVRPQTTTPSALAAAIQGTWFFSDCLGPSNGDNAHAMTLRIQDNTISDTDDGYTTRSTIVSNDGWSLVTRYPDGSGGQTFQISNGFLSVTSNPGSQTEEFVHCAR